jgi:hypothetical protein
VNRTRLLAAVAGLTVLAAVIANVLLGRPDAPTPAIANHVSTPEPIAPEITSLPAIRNSEFGIPTPAPEPSPKTNSRARGSPLAAELNAPGFDAQHDVATLHAMLRQYQRLLRGRQGRPLGNDSDLAHVLTGHNPMKLVILPANHSALTPDGRLQDRWGTPYFIHPRGQGAFEIRSAGPDRKLFTADDVIQNPGGRTTADLPDLPNTAEPPEE